jgi:hypothetical protein
VMHCFSRNKANEFFSRVAHNPSLVTALRLSG